MARGRYINKTESSPETIVNTTYNLSSFKSHNWGHTMFHAQRQSKCPKILEFNDEAMDGGQVMPFFLYSHLFGGLCVRRQVMK